MNMKCPMCGTDKFCLDLDVQKVSCSSCGFYFDLNALIRGNKIQHEPEAHAAESMPVIPDKTEFNHSDDFEIVGGVLKVYKGEAIDVVVPEGVLEIGVQAFKEMTQIRTIHLPESLKVIRREAFWGCKNLMKINIPKSVELFEYSIIRTHRQDSDGEWFVSKVKKPRCFWGCGNLAEIVHDWDYLLLYTFEGTLYVENRKALIKQGKCPQCEGKISNFLKKCDRCQISWTTLNTGKWGVIKLDLSGHNLQGDYWD